MKDWKDEGRGGDGDGDGARTSVHARGLSGAGPERPKKTSNLKRQARVSRRTASFMMYKASLQLIPLWCSGHVDPFICPGMNAHE